MIKIIKEVHKDYKIDLYAEVLKPNTLKPDDIIFIHYPGQLSRQGEQNLIDSFKSIFPNNKVYILEEGLKFSITSHNDPLR